ncbi:MAG: copper chaperone PCu(A)C [Caldilinea sp.]
MPKPSVLWIVLGASLLLWLAGCSPIRGPQPAAQATAAPLPEAGVLAIVDARARPAPLPGGTSAIYFTVLNGLDQPVQLVSAASPAARAVETHETVAEEGVMKMIPLPDGYPVPAGTTLTLQPGGKHIMLIDLVEPLAPGDTIELTVTFDNGQVFELNVPVLDPQLNRPVDAEGRAALGGPQDQPVTHDHESMQGEAPHEHAQMHGDSTALSPELAAALEALPVGAIHQLDEAIAQGNDWDADAARTTVDDLITRLDAFSWPDDLLPSIEAIRTHAVDLHDAIEAGDPARVGELAAALHHLLHALVP